MTKRLSSVTSALFVTTILGGLLATQSVHAQSNAELQQRIQKLENELQDLKQQVQENQKKEATASPAAAAPETLPDLTWHLGGYATADLTASNSSSEHDTFVGGQFSPIFLVSYKDLLIAESELEISTTSDGETDMQLEFGNLSLNVADWLTITAGKFLSPIGDFQQHLHPTWINKLPDRPAGFVEDGGDEHLSEVGVMARGAVPVGSTVVDYAVFVGNGPRLAESLDEGVKLEGFSGDNNGNKAVGGRIGIRPLPYLSVGVSAMTASISGNEGIGGSVTSGNYHLEDVDFAFTRKNWDVRGEYIRSHLDSLLTAVDSTSAPAMIPASNWHNWYLQAAYRLAGVSDNKILSHVEPVIRYSQLHISGFDLFRDGEEDRWTLGLDYWFSSSLVAKTAYENRNYLNEPNEDVFRMQLAFGF